MRARGSSAELVLVPAFSVVIGVALAACFEPVVDHRCRITCDDLRCPLGLSCESDGFCHRLDDPADPVDCVPGTGDAADPMFDATIPDAAPPQERVVAISAGSHHVCVVDADTRLVCWGDNRRSQLGLPTSIRRTGTPTLVGDMTVWSDVDAGFSHTCGVNNGELYCWGNNDSGQCGSRGGGTVIEPTRIGSMMGWIDVAAGASHSCAIREDGTERRVYCWGWDTQGQLGDGELDSSGSTPREIAMTSDGTYTDWVEVVAGYDHTCAIREGGETYCWGNNDHGQLGDDSEIDRYVPTRVRASFPNGLAVYWAVDAGANATCALGRVADASDGELYCFGDNSGNLLGLPGMGEADVPTQLEDGGDWGSFSVGTYTTCGSREDGPYCWGNGYQGGIGNGQWQIATSPVAVSNLDGRHDLVAGTDFACAAAHEGGVWCWGGNPHGEQGDGTVATKFAPELIDSAGAWTWVSTGEVHSCGIRDGELYCWGWNESAQLGLAGTPEAYEPTHVDPGDPAGVWTEVEVGHRTTCAIEEVGGVPGTRNVWCWGFDSEGQTGQGATGARSPQIVASNTGGWHSLTHSGNSVCVLAGMTRWCWGQGANFALGNNSTSMVTTPMAVADSSDWTSVTLGAQFGCGVRATSSALECWGTDNRGQQGNGAGVTQAMVPTPGPGLTTNVVAASFRGDHACAVASGQLRCWGRNEYEQGGLSSGDADLDVPTQAGTGLTFEALSTGTRHSCGIDDGRLYCWGDNIGLQCGNELLGFSVQVPTQIGSASDWVRIDAGFEHSCGIRGDDLYCWGSNTHGQIGDGSGARDVPFALTLPATTPSI